MAKVLPHVRRGVVIADTRGLLWRRTIRYALARFKDFHLYYRSPDAVSAVPHRHGRQRRRPLHHGRGRRHVAGVVAPRGQGDHFGTGAASRRASSFSKVARDCSASAVCPVRR